MPLEGISVITEDKYVLCSIDAFSDDLKDLIRNELRAICHGKTEVEAFNLSRYSYKNTLKEFLTRYTPKDENTKKGMMGEFIAHLVIDKVLPNLKKITILFNKEELSIRKGFDLTYLEVDGGFIWYGEVKSGELNQEDTPDSKNRSLLHDSKSGMRDFLTGQRPHLWNSVITDVSLSLAHDEHKKVKELLDEDLQEIENDGTKKNAILISVLFHDTQNKVSVENIKNCVVEIASEDIFSDVILFSIQKSTYSKIEEFLHEEANNI